MAHVAHTDDDTVLDEACFDRAKYADGRQEGLVGYLQDYEQYLSHLEDIAYVPAADLQFQVPPNLSDMRQVLYTRSKMWIRTARVA